jgi:hypothetical protein
MRTQGVTIVWWLAMGIAFCCWTPEKSWGDACVCGVPNVEFGDGSDGDWIVPTGAHVLPANMNYRNVRVPSGATLDTAGRVLRVCGTLTVDGTITDTVNGGLGGAGGQGGSGGVGCYPHSPPSSGSAGGAGQSASCSGGGHGGRGGGGGGGGAGAWNTCCPTIGCTPGGDGGTGGAGGRGGGCVTIWAYLFDNRGTVQADGHSGNTGAAGENGSYEYYVCLLLDRDQDSGGGGGGGGGSGGNGGHVEIHYVERPSAGNVHAHGGTRGGGGARGVQPMPCQEEYPTAGACQHWEVGASGYGNGGDGGESDIGLTCANDADNGDPGSNGTDGTVSWIQHTMDINCEALSGFNYGSVCAGQQVDHSWSVANEGDAPLLIDSISIAGTHAAEFSCQTGCGTGITLCPGERRTVTVRFQPAGSGAKSATLRIISDDPDEGPCDMPLSGTGKALSTAPTDATANPSAICPGGSSTLTVQGGSLGTGASWHWYSGTCGGTPVGTGASINVSPSATTTYYVRAEGDCNTTTCASVTVTVKTLSTAPSGATADANAVCPGDSAELCVQGGSLGTGGSWEWYSESCGGTYVGTGSCTDVTPSSTTTYYVRAEGDCNTTSCASVTVTVKALSTAPSGATADPSEVCPGDSSELCVQGGSLGTGGSWEWYSESCGGTYVGTGSCTDVTPSSTTTYSVRAEGDCNTTACASVIVTVDPPSVAPSEAFADPNPAYPGQPVTLMATGGSGGTLWWYVGGCGVGAPIGSAQSIDIVAPESTTTYYVRTEGPCGDSSCATVTLVVWISCQYTIGGAIFDDCNDPLGSGVAGVEVIVEGDLTISTLSFGEQGLWVIEDVPCGDYTVTPSLPAWTFCHVETECPPPACYPSCSITVDGPHEPENQSIKFLAVEEPTGACCFANGTCQNLTEAVCQSAGGFWEGPGTECGAAACLGACCLNDGALCIELAGSDCDALSGDWPGFGTSCTDGNSNGTADACEPPIPGDCDRDLQVDLDDFASFANAMAGPSQPAGLGCDVGDFDGDGDIDLADFAEFQVAFGAP